MFRLSTSAVWICLMTSFDPLLAQLPALHPTAQSPAVHGPGGSVCPHAICPRHGGSIHRRGGWADRTLFIVLDNLIVEKRVPVMIAISIGNGSGDAQGSERGLEYDTMSGLYAEFVEKEV